MSEIILASSSQYRKELLQRLQIPFLQKAANIDETPLPNQTAEQTASRLAYEKAKSIQAHHMEDLIIGSDQTACIAGDPKIIGKPHTHAQAIQQLLQMQGREIHFYTALCILYRSDVKQAIDCTRLYMRPLSLKEIESYLNKEPAYDVAGSAKIECLGISLMESVHSSDPTALIGLPLITVARFLREFGHAVP